MRVRAQFWAPYRGLVDAEIVTVPTMTADEIGRLLYDKAVRAFDAKWRFPKVVQREMQVVGVTNGIETANGGLK